MAIGEETAAAGGWKRPAVKLGKAAGFIGGILFAFLLAIGAAVAWEAWEEADHESAEAFLRLIIDTVAAVGEGLVWLARAVVQQASSAWPLTLCLTAMLFAMLWLGRRGSLLPGPLSTWPISIEFLIAKHKTAPLTQRMMKAFLYQYARQEDMQISGQLRYRIGLDAREPRNRIYTSFVSYSELVEVILKQRLTENQDDEIVCFATISMPLPQWFNNQIRVTVSGDDESAQFNDEAERQRAQQRRREEESLPYRGLHSDWQTYATLMHRLASTGPGRLNHDRCKIYRIINVYDGAMRKGAFFPELQMKDWSQASILLPCNQTGSIDVGRPPEPCTREERLRLLSHVPDPALSDRIARMYATEELSHIIVPDKHLDGRVNDRGWRSVGHAFNSMFAPDNPDHPRCFVNRIDDDTLVRDYQSDTGLPNDMFLVGVRARGQNTPSWRICLAGTTDEGYQMVRLEYGTHMIADERIQRIQQFADETLESIRTREYGTTLVEMRTWLGAQ